MTVDTWTLAGEKAEKTTLPEKVFGVKVEKTLLAQAARVFLSNQRTASSKTKTRGEIAKTTAKMFKQKGTGRARHGSYSAPIFVGGGISHGPDGRQNYTKKMTAKMNKLALAQALSDKANDKRIMAVTGADKIKGKTQEVVDLVKKADIKGKILVVGTAEQKTWTRAWKNVASARVVSTHQINAFLVIANKNLFMTVEAVKELAKKYVD